MRAKKAVSPHAECSHCWEKGHLSRATCPDKHRSHKELVEEGLKRSAARDEAVERIADAISAIDPADRVSLTVRAFNKVVGQEMGATMRAVFDRGYEDEKAFEDAITPRAAIRPKTDLTTDDDSHQGARLSDHQRDPANGGA